MGVVAVEGRLPVFSGRQRCQNTWELNCGKKDTLWLALLEPSPKPQIYFKKINYTHYQNRDLGVEAASRAGS